MIFDTRKQALDSLREFVLWLRNAHEVVQFWSTKDSKFKWTRRLRTTSRLYQQLLMEGIMKKVLKRRCAEARALAGKLFRPRIIPDGTIYARMRDKRDWKKVELERWMDR